MKQALLFFDIDGTLVPDGSEEVPASAREGLRLARQAGCRIFINTGRTYSILTASVRTLRPDGFICGCGTAVYLNGQRVFYRKPSPECCRRTVRALRRAGIPTVYEGDSAEFFDQCSHGRHSPRVQRNRRRFADVAVDLTEPLPEDLAFEKFVCFGQPYRRQKTLERLLSQDFDIIRREGEMAEIVLKGYSKGTGIRWLADYLQVDLQDCYAFGDSLNDVEMLQAVPHSVAMGNSVPGLKPLCEYVTTDIWDDGVYNALAHYGLLES